MRAGAYWTEWVMRGEYEDEKAESRSRRGKIKPWATIDEGTQRRIRNSRVDSDS